MIVDLGLAVASHQHKTPRGENDAEREKKIMFQRVALTFYDTAYVRSQAGADKRNNPSLCKYRKKPYFSFFLSVEAGVVGGCDGILKGKKDATKGTLLFQGCRKGTILLFLSPALMPHPREDSRK